MSLGRQIHFFNNNNNNRGNKGNKGNNKETTNNKNLRNGLVSEHIIRIRRLLDPVKLELPQLIIIPITNVISLYFIAIKSSLDCKIYRMAWNSVIYNCHHHQHVDNCHHDYLSLLSQSSRSSQVNNNLLHPLDGLGSPPLLVRVHHQLPLPACNNTVNTIRLEKTWFPTRLPSFTSLPPLEPFIPQLPALEPGLSSLSQIPLWPNYIRGVWISSQPTNRSPHDGTSPFVVLQVRPNLKEIEI